MGIVDGLDVSNDVGVIYNNQDMSSLPATHNLHRESAWEKKRKKRPWGWWRQGSAIPCLYQLRDVVLFDDRFSTHGIEPHAVVVRNNQQRHLRVSGVISEQKKSGIMRCSDMQVRRIHNASQLACLLDSKIVPHYRRIVFLVPAKHVPSTSICIDCPSHASVACRLTDVRARTPATIIGTCVLLSSNSKVT